MMIGDFELEQKVMVIAEIGNNHEGSYGLACDLIGMAAQAGADAVKFQTFRAEHYVSPGDKERFARLQKFELTLEQFANLSKRAEKAGLAFISTPFDLASARGLNSMVASYKISSGDNTFYPLLEACAITGKPIIMSSGLVDIDELRYSTALIRKIWSEQGIAQELAVLHCVSSYPVPPEQANLNAIRHIGEALNCTAGYSDHTMGIEAPVLAVALGARIIEKHFTIDHNYSDFRDHQLSADPGQLKMMVERIREAESYLGKPFKEVQACETAGLTSMRRSVAAAKDLATGHILCWDDITWIRPGGGIAPGRENLVLGRKCSVPIGAGEIISLDQLV